MSGPGIPQMGGIQQLPAQFPNMHMQNFSQMLPVGLGMGQVGFVPPE